jgi:hypothetical protein
MYACACVYVRVCVYVCAAFVARALVLLPLVWVLVLWVLVLLWALFSAVADPHVCHLVLTRDV